MNRPRGLSQLLASLQASDFPRNGTIEIYIDCPPLALYPNVTAFEMGERNATIRMADKLNRTRGNVYIRTTRKPKGLRDSWLEAWPFPADDAEVSV